jgi:glycyl-tRNA synthetase beta chain
MLKAELELFKRDDGLSNKIKNFWRERLEAWLLDKGVRYDIVDAVLAVTLDDPLDVWKRCQALSELRGSEEFEPLIIGQKRVANILKGLETPRPPRPTELMEEAEINLYRQAEELEPQLSRLTHFQQYKEGLLLLLTLRKPIDILFDEVLIMAEDQRLRKIRLGLVGWIKSLFDRIADLSRIVLEGN